MAPSSNWTRNPASHAGNVGSFPAGVTIGQRPTKLSRNYLPQVHSTEAMLFVFFMLLSAGYHIKLPTPHIAGRANG